MKMIINREKIIRARVAKGLSTAQVGERARVSGVTVWATEQGKSTPRPDTLVRICKAVDCDPNDVIKMMA